LVNTRLLESNVKKADCQKPLLLAQGQGK